MPPRIIASCVDVHWRYTFDGNACENVMQYAYNDGATPTSLDLQNLAVNLVANMLPTIRAMLPGSCIFREIFIRDLHAASGRAQYSQDLLGVTGLRGGDPVPGSIAMNIISRTGLTGRGSHGAKRMGPFSEQDVSLNKLGAGLVTLAINFGLQWLVTRVIGSFTWQPAVAHLALHSRNAIRAVVINNNSADSQKTRLDYHGE